MQLERKMIEKYFAIYKRKRISNDNNLLKKSIIKEEEQKNMDVLEHYISSS